MATIDMGNNIFNNIGDLNPTDSSAATTIRTSLNAAASGANSDITSLNALTLPFEGVISLIQNVDFTATATTALYTVPVSRSAIVTRLIVRPTTVTTFATPATFNVGVGAGVGDIIAGDAIPDLDSTGLYAISEPIAAPSIAAATNVINLNVTVAAGAAAFLADVILIGYIVP